MNRILVFVSNQFGQLIDSRDYQDLAPQLSNKMRLLINNVNNIKSDDTGENLMLYEDSYVRSFSVIKYADLFTFYFTNKYWAVSARDLTKMSTWLDETWTLYLSK